MIQDLHSHTYYSFCGEDKPEVVVEAAIAGGIEVLGITDHNHGIGNARTNVFFHELNGLDDNYERTLVRYFDHINLLKEKYAGQIEILRGVEICTLNHGRNALPDNADVSFFDYCIVEQLDRPKESIAKGDIFAFAKRCGCPTGIAHTDMFSFIASCGENPFEYFSRMAEAGIFWEMNVNLDTIHRGHEHKYMLEFFENEEQQDIVRRSGVRLSVGFDGHRIRDYKPARIASYCERIGTLGIKLAFED